METKIKKKYDSPIKAFDIQKFDNKIDLWHVSGSPNFHENFNHRDFIEKCKKKLPQVKLPIIVGHTGYIYFDESKLDIVRKSNKCWDIDEYGRILIIINDHIFFQRMINGSILMHGSIVNNESYQIGFDSSSKPIDIDINIVNIVDHYDGKIYTK